MKTLGAESNSTNHKTGIVEMENESLEPEMQPQIDIHHLYQNDDANIPIQRQSHFPNPNDHAWYGRVGAGMMYPLEATKLCFTKFFAVFAILDSLLVTFVILFSVGLGIGLGVIIPWYAWPKPADIWVLGSGWFWYNLYMIWCLLIIFLCFFFTGIFLTIGLFIATIIIDKNGIKLSYLVEMDMTGEKVDLHDLFFGEGIDKRKFGTMAWCNDYCESQLRGCFFRLLKKIKLIARRYAIKFAQFVIVAAIQAVILTPIPGIGLIVSILIFLILLIVEVPSFGLDFIFSRREYNFLDEEKTKWNNLFNIIGCGLGTCGLMIICPPLLLLLYPIIVISTTRMFVHLESHGECKTKPWQYPFGIGKKKV